MYPDRGLSRYHRWYFQDGNELLPFLFFAVPTVPYVSTLGFRLLEQNKNLNVPLPHGLAFRNLVNRHGGMPIRGTVKQVRHRRSKSIKIFLLIHRNVSTG